MGLFSEMIAALKKSESEQDYKHILLKASEKLGKAYTEPEIRLLVEGLSQKNSVDMYMTTAYFQIFGCSLTHKSVL